MPSKSTARRRLHHRQRPRSNRRQNSGSTFDINASASVTSDYNYRGYTLSDHRPSASTNWEATYNIFFAGINAASVQMPMLSQIQTTSYGGIRPVFGNLTVETGIGYFSYPGSPIDISYPEYYIAPSYALTPKLTRRREYLLRARLQPHRRLGELQLGQRQIHIRFGPVGLRRTRPPEFQHHQTDGACRRGQAARLHLLEFRICLHVQGPDVRSALFRDHAVEAELQSDHRHRPVGRGIERLHSRDHRHVCRGAPICPG